MMETNRFSNMKIALSMRCSPSHQDYMVITNDLPNIPFYVITKKVNENLKFVETYGQFTILNLQNIYFTVLFVFGIKILPGIMFKKTIEIWHK